LLLFVKNGLQWCDNGIGEILLFNGNKLQ